MTPLPGPLPDDVLLGLRSGALGAEGIRDLLAEREVRFLRLHFTDLAGAPRHVDVPAGRLEDALAGGVAFDGSPAGGEVRTEDADLLLRPEAGTLRLLPWGGVRGALLICDLHRPDGTPFEGDPRGVLRRAIREAESEGYRPLVGAEMEFFLLPAAGTGRLPRSEGEAARQAIVEALEGMGVPVAAAHPDPAPGQHQIDLLPTDALSLADHLATLKLAAREVAEARGIRVTFMPKPLFGENGSGLHLHHALFREAANAFADPEAPEGVSAVLRSFVGGVLRHARGSAAVTNPLVNSYKRLVPGFSAPLYATWSLQDGSSLVRVPPVRAGETRCEVRLADSAANPYLALAVQLAAGLDGVRGEADPGAPVSRQTGTMSGRELQRRRIPVMPRHLGDALLALEEDRVVRAALGEYVFSHLVGAQRAEWEAYVAQVHPWERERYLDV